MNKFYLVCFILTFIPMLGTSIICGYYLGKNGYDLKFFTFFLPSLIWTIFWFIYVALSDKK